MATLQGTSLLGCNYIPDFIASGSIMVFENATSPTSWTKLTTVNDNTLRIVSGSISSGGSLSFPTIFAQRAVSGSVGTGTATVFWSSATGSVSVNSATASSVSISPAVFYTSVHTHTYTYNSTTQRNGGPVTARQAIPATKVTGAIGLNLPHTHGASFTPSPHTHTATASSHTHPSLSWSHNHGAVFSGLIDCRLFYVDVILASKD